MLTLQKMNFITVCTLFSFILFHVCLSASSDTLQFKITHYNKCLKSDLVLEYFLKISLKKCVRRCAVRPACQSVNYRRNHLLCELYLEEHGTFIENSGKTGSCVFVGRSSIDFQIPQECLCKYMETCDDKSKTCQRRECHKLIIDQGVVVGNRNTIGSKVNVSCNYMYGTTYYHTWWTQTTCEDDGQWSYIPSCIRKCPQILTLVDGVINMSSQTPGSEMTFACNENYTEVENRTEAACLYTGEWAYVPRCELIVCPELILNNGILKGLFNNTGENLRIPGTQVRFVCNANYAEAENKTQATCNITGQWSYVPNCITVACSTSAQLSYYKDNYENIALNKTVTMKDMFLDISSGSLMVDGNLNPNHPHCSHTKTTQNSFALIDLGQNYTIYAVYILNRRDCCADRLRDVRITIGESLDTLKLFAHHLPVIGNDCTFIMTQPCRGRYLRIVNTDLALLTICELEVYGSRNFE